MQWLLNKLLLAIHLETCKCSVLLAIYLASILLGYVAVASPYTNYNIAGMQSPIFTPSQAMCLQFYYKLNNLGKLTNEVGDNL